MLTIAASVILEDAYRLIGWDPDQLETRQQQMARQAFSMALQEVWESWWWEELMASAQFNGATVYSATVVTVADTFYYFPATQDYYQCLVAATGQDPATFDSNSQTYTVNFAYWARAHAQTRAGNYNAATIYKLGDQVRGLTDGLTYQLISLLPVLEYTNGTTLHNQPMTYAGLQNGAVSYALQDDAGNAGGIFWGGLFWVLQLVDQHTHTPFTQATCNILGPIPGGVPFGGWTDGGTISPVSEITAPPSANWHALIPFTPEVTVPGQVRAVGRTDPRNSPGVGLQTFELVADGDYRLPGWHHGVPWVWYRATTPIIDADAFDATVAYFDQQGNGANVVPIVPDIGIATEDGSGNTIVSETGEKILNETST